MDLEGLPVPDNAPPRGSCVKIERPEAGVVVLRLDPPHRKIAVLDVPLILDLEDALDKIEMDAGMRALVITGAQPTRFAAGADLDAIERVSDPAVVRRMARGVQDLFHRIYKLGKRRPRPVRTVAAVGGPVPGGAYELSLACSIIIACDDPKTRIGLPETQLGILPGWGGCQRLPRRIGVPAALDAILSGRLLPAEAALKKGLVDRIVKPEIFDEVVIDVASGRRSQRLRTRGASAWLVDRNPLATGFVARMARREVMRRTRGHYPAPLAAIELVARAPRTPFKEGFEDEAREVSELATSAVCKNLVSVFRLSEAAKKLGKFPEGADVPPPIERAAVIGAGVMGGGIASLMADRGIRARLSDLSQKALDAAVFEHRKDIEKRRRKRRLKNHEAIAAIDRLDAATGLVGLGGSRLVVEAVAERLDIKRAVFGEVAKLVSAEAILATNTSSLSVTAIARDLPRPERVVGLHFFNPVKRMPLVEIVRGEQTSDSVVTETARLALRLGKTPVIVKDVPGFLVNRLLGPYLDEALRLFAAGIPAKRIEDPIEEFGMPMGPLALLDEVGFDIARHAATSLHEGYGVRMTPSDGLDKIFDAEHRIGKKTGRGFYLHDPKKGGGSRELCEDLFNFQPQQDVPQLSDEQVVDRCILAMLAEGVRALEEGVTRTADELDLATIFGMGFPPFTGGLLAWADSVGPATLVDKLEKIAASEDVAERPGGPERFAPPRLLREMAASGGRFRASTGAPRASEHAGESRRRETALSTSDA